jgi:NAD-dependent dihydropyrimidine dehydrogenase PreA subunit
MTPLYFCSYLHTTAHIALIFLPAVSSSAESTRSTASTQPKQEDECHASLLCQAVCSATSATSATDQHCGLKAIFSSLLHI